MKAFVGVFKAYNILITQDRKFIEIHLVITDNKEDFTSIIIVDKDNIDFWKKFINELNSSFEKLEDEKNKKIKKSNTNYFG